MVSREVSTLNPDPSLRKSPRFSKNPPLFVFKNLPIVILREHGFPEIYCFMVWMDLPEKTTYTISIAKKVLIYIKIVALKDKAQ